MKKSFYILTVCLSLSACSSNNTWVGVSEDTVIERFGMPMKSYQTDTRKYMVYNLMGINYAVHPENVIVKTNNTPLNGECTGTFIVEDSTVEKFTVQGNACQIYESQN